MAYVYARLIVKGVKMFEEVPDVIKEEVRQELINMEHEELIDQ